MSQKCIHTTRYKILNVMNIYVYIYIYIYMCVCKSIIRKYICIYNMIHLFIYGNNCININMNASFN